MTKPIRASQVELTEVDLKEAALTEQQQSEQKARQARMGRSARRSALTGLGATTTGLGSPDLHARLEAKSRAASAARMSGWRARQVVKSKLDQ